MSINLKSLIGKLNETSRMATERAATLCMSRGQYEVDLEHLFLALLEQPQSDFSLIAHHSGVSNDSLQADLEHEIASFKNGNTRTPVLSPHLQTLFEHAWLIASLEGSNPRIRSGHLLLSLLTHSELSQLAYRGSRLFAHFKIEQIKHDLRKLTVGSVESAVGIEYSVSPEDSGLSQGDPVGEMQVGSGGKTAVLDQYTINLTQLARLGKVDPVVGRDAEIRQAVDILLRRRQNNPILTGEAGVGKTAVVEGLALSIVRGDVPQALQGVEIHTLDMGLLQAGASVKGEFENRLKNVIDAVKSSPHPIILFIDEAHTMIGAGGQAGQNDAANLLKPALARGELRTIAATTWTEYKKYFEKDAALARRFQVIKIEEPNEETACAMLRAMVPLMEGHFGVRIYDEAVKEAVRLSHRYITGQQLPDKAVSVLDTACARVALGQSATPPSLGDLKRRLEEIDAEMLALEREVAIDIAHEARLTQLSRQRVATLAHLEALKARWQRERELNEHIQNVRATLEMQTQEGSPGQDPAQARAELRQLMDELRLYQGETPLLPVQVDGQIVAEIVSGWTGIPLGKMVKDEIKTVLGLDALLQERVLGQRHATDAVAQRVRTSRANLDDPGKPKGVFLFVGPSGVGKTETALTLADVLYGGERKLITINMSEYQEAHTVSGLKGSPPGYVGYGEGGVLTEAVRRNPYSVVLLDEVEKAHPDVLELFFQVFDKGVLDDGEGRQIDFRNCIIILTSNVASAQMMQACLNKVSDELPTPDELDALIRPQLVRAFKPAFLGRLKVIPYYPIADDILVKIIELKLSRIAKRIEANHKAEFVYDKTLVDAVLARCTEVDSGARNVDNILNGSLLPEIAGSVLARMAEAQGISRIKVSASKKGVFKYVIQ
ncbi:type VI secretion system ATPase TssH [Herbaspirillum frisingense]|uniref:type VI secretion system ATPase TssH n=1 Tax=Herbaspirillum frisingense TaxID=92645 RepID=UPI00160214E5|nr:type VI secretion system ATPase TssH [Herbaspirillum frisingense]QNB09129.1 type VI secretion system ATPase TssH [Herbaspirillum frisingense]